MGSRTHEANWLGRTLAVSGAACAMLVLACFAQGDGETRLLALCRVPPNSAMLSRAATRTVQPGSVEVDFVLSVTDSTLATASAELCAHVGDRVVYRDRWDVNNWFIGPSAVPANDSAIGAIVEAFFRQSAFHSFPPAWAEMPWFAEFETNPYAPVAQDLKEAEYRRVHRLTAIAPLPRSVIDSLRTAPMDSVRVRQVVAGLVANRVTTFTYWTGDESVIQIAWWPEGKRFLRVMR